MYYMVDPLRGWRMWSGQIGSGDLSGRGGDSLSVNTNTCGYGEVDGCGYVSLEFRESDGMTRIVDGKTTTISGDTRTMQIGRTETSTASVSGTVLGISMTGAGEIATGKMTDMQVHKGK
jgi:hypothetical protein